MALVLLPFFIAGEFSTPSRSPSQREYTAARYSSSLHPLVGAASNPEANWSASCGESSSDFFSESASDSSCAEERQRIGCQILIQRLAGGLESDWTHSLVKIRST